MPVRIQPLLDSECLIRIFNAEGFSVREAGDGWLVFEKPGLATAPILRRGTFLGPVEIGDLLYNAGIDYQRFLELREKYCPPEPLSPV